MKDCALVKGDFPTSSSLHLFISSSGSRITTPQHCIFSFHWKTAPKLPGNVKKSSPVKAGSLKCCGTMGTMKNYASEQHPPNFKFHSFEESSPALTSKIRWGERNQLIRYSYRGQECVLGCLVLQTFVVYYRMIYTNDMPEMINSLQIMYPKSHGDGKWFSFV